MTTATATCDHITRDEALSEQETLRQNLARFINGLTDNGNELAQFMYDIFKGEYPDAKLHHRQIAARDLAVMSGQMPEDTPGSAARIVRVSDADPKPNKKPKITMKEIANWHMGRSIRAQSDDCRDLVMELRKFLSPPYVFPSANPDEQKYQKATQVKAHHQVAAAQELIKRIGGSRNPDCAVKTSYLEEKMLHSRLARDLSEITGDGVELTTFLFYVIYNPKHDGWGEIIADPYTQTHRLWSLKHLLWRGADIPWEHITAEDIEEYLRDLDEKERQELERRRAERRAAAKLTPEQEAEVLAIFEETQRKLEDVQAKAAAKAEKKAQKAAKKEATAKAADLDAANKNTCDTGNGDNASSNNKNVANGNNANSADSANAPPSATATPPADPGPTAVANALARHPNVDLDTALANHHSTAGIPKENLTHAQIYEAITAEANFQKRQAIIQNRLRAKNPDAPADGTDPKSRSP